MKVSDFEYHLPSHLIARYPTKDRTGSRLLHLNASTGDIRHMHFRDIIDLIEPKDLMVFNNTQVIPARFFGRKDSGGKVEILLERVIDQTTALAQVRASKGPKPGGVIFLDDGAELSVLFQDVLLDVLLNLAELSLHPQGLDLDVVECALVARVPRELRLAALDE